MNALEIVIKRYELLSDLADKRNDVREYWRYTGAADALRELERHNEKKGERMARSQMDDHPPGK